jgi:mRNA-degrading endonuclease RelE of RelBE toxin-antitoxin system
MADKYQKFIKKLSAKEYQRVSVAVKRYSLGKLVGMNVKKMKGHDDIYRVRVGRIRIIFYNNNVVSPILLNISFRDDQTYRDF